MAQGITIIDRQWVNDIDANNGTQIRKEVVTYSVASSSLINSILTFYPNTGEGSFALCIPEGVCKTLLDGIWI